ncbi:MAG: hypothetical protein FWC16_07985 [Defluviitaleaceae bacterium]|nr:hypothetical protein [Defluviitaleaceae bacterium]MCL2274852.1 hypothetical protein [Defluviitaleaceae bacterium]
MKHIDDIFKAHPVRTLWDDTAQKWWFCAVDICALLNGGDTQKARIYWNTHKCRTLAEESQPLTICNQLKMKSHDGKLRFTDVLDTEEVLYLIAAVPAKTPFKRWLAHAAANGYAARQLENLAKRNAASTMREIAVENMPLKRQTVRRERLV